MYAQRESVASQSQYELIVKGLQWERIKHFSQLEEKKQNPEEEDAEVRWNSDDVPWQFV